MKIFAQPISLSEEQINNYLKNNFDELEGIEGIYTINLFFQEPPPCLSAL